MNINAFMFGVYCFLGSLSTGVVAATPTDFSAMPDHPTLTIDHWQTSNGASVYFVQTPDIPILDVKVIFNAGSARDGDLAGVAWITNALLDEGTSALSADELAAQFDEIGAQISTYALRDMATIEMRTLTDRAVLHKAVSLTHDIVKTPSFPEKSLLQIKNQILVSLEKQKKLPGALADRIFWSTLYQGHPYAHPVQGTEQSLPHIHRSSIVDFYKRFYVGKNATLALVGDIDKTTAHRISEQLLGDLATGNAAPPLPAVIDFDNVPQHTSIDFPSTQTHIMIGMPLLTRTDPNYISLMVANHILGGGGFGSILMKSIREDRGLAYSIDSQITAMQAKGPFDITLQTKNNTSAEAIKIVQQELNSFVVNGPSEEQLEHAKQEIIGQQPLSIADNDSIAAYIAMLGFYHLPLDYYDTFKSGVQNLSTQDVKEDLQKYIDPQKVKIVTVGQPHANQ